MSNKENTGIIKWESSTILKVGNQITITNKLLYNSFDYLKWWEDLEREWKNRFIACIELEIAWINLGRVLQEREFTQDELRVKKIFENYNQGDNEDNYIPNIEAIKYLIRMTKKIIVFNEVKNLEPLKLFTELEELEVRDIEIESLEPLFRLQKLKELNLSKANIGRIEIAEFRERNPNCIVIIPELMAKENEIFAKMIWDKAEKLKAKLKAEGLQKDSMKSDD